MVALFEGVRDWGRIMLYCIECGIMLFNWTVSSGERAAVLFWKVMTWLALWATMFAYDDLEVFTLLGFYALEDTDCITLRESYFDY